MSFTVNDTRRQRQEAIDMHWMCHIIESEASAIRWINNFEDDRLLRILTLRFAAATAFGANVNIQTFQKHLNCVLYSPTLANLCCALFFKSKLHTAYRRKEPKTLTGGQNPCISVVFFDKLPFSICDCRCNLGGTQDLLRSSYLK